MIRKTCLVCAVLAIFAVFIGLRVIAALQDGYIGNDPLTVPVSSAAPASDSALSASADLTLPSSAVSDAYRDAADVYNYLISYNGYSTAGTLNRSGDASAFFAGYLPRVTDDTVFLPPNTSGDYVSNPAPTQGSADDVNAPATETYFSMDEVFLDSDYAVLVDLDEGVIVCARGADEPIYPASMVKILTLLTASEQIRDRDGSFTITQDIVDTTWKNGLSSVYWEVGETVFLSDMEYGTILPSGADAAIGLACYAAGSEGALVNLMNDRVRAMQLSEHASFTNVTGMHDAAMTCTVTDMAMIMKAAMESRHVQDIMSVREYTATATPFHPDGVYMFNMFLDRTDQRVMPGKILCAKTGYTDHALNCAASYFISNSGKHYVCVTAHGHGQIRTVTDHVNLYSTYTR